MEKNVFLAIILTFAVLMIWSSFQEQPQRDDQKPQSETTTTNKAGTGTGTGEPGDAGSGASGTDTPSTVPPVVTMDQPELTAEEKLPIILQNEASWVSLSPRGAVVSSARLKDFSATAAGGEEGVDAWLELIKTYKGGPSCGALSMDDGPLSGVLNSREWRGALHEDGQGATFTLQVKTPTGVQRFTKTYALVDELTRLRVTVKAEPVDGGGVGGLPFEGTLWLAASGGVFPKDSLMAQPHSLMGQVGEDDWEVEEWGQGDLDELEGRQKALMNRSVRFVCDMGEYFGAYLTATSGASPSGARTHLIVTDPDSVELHGPTRTWSEMAFYLGKEEAEASFDIYFGPKDHRYIKAAYEEGESREAYLDVAHHELTSQACCSSLGPLGSVINLVSMAVLSLLALFHDNLFGSMGISIIFLTFCVRVLLFPITRKSQVSMHRHQKKMARLKPQIDKLKEKYKGDKQKFAQEQFKLMKDEKMSLLPLGGCLPLFLQMPIFFGLFSAIRFDVDLRHASFLWAEDLSRPDAFMTFSNGFDLPCCIGPGVQINGLNILPILMTVAWVVNQKMMPKSPDPQVQQQQKMMLFMPIMFGVMMYSYAAGLSLYWLTSSLFGIFEQRVIKKVFPLDRDEEPTPVKA